MTLIDAVGAELAASAYRGDPLDARAVADLPTVLHVGTDGNDNPCAFVACNAVGCGLHAKGPFVVEKGFVGGAEAGVVDLDEDLIGGGELHWDVLDGDCGRVAGALLDGCFLGFGELHGKDVDL